MLKARRFLTQLAKPLISKAYFCTSAAPQTETISLYEKFKGFRNTALENVDIPGVTIVNTKDKAKRAVDVLMSLEDR